MNKHSMAIAFALIGLGIAGFATEFSTMGIICGLGFGAFIGYFVAGLVSAKGNLLQRILLQWATLRARPLTKSRQKSANRMQ